MSDPQSLIAAAQRMAPADPRAAIARAAAATGVDFRYLFAQARLESSLDPGARARGSSAAGLYQFTDATWLRTLGRHAAEHGLDWAGAAIDGGGRIADPALRAQVMGLRYDPEAASLMAAELARDNRAQLTAQLGRSPDASELYLAHFLGASGAVQLLTVVASDPVASAAALLPKAAAANPSVFYAAGGAPRSVTEVRDMLRARLQSAMADDGGFETTGADIVGGGADAGFGAGYGTSWAAVGTTPADPQPLPASAGPLARAFHAINLAADGAAGGAAGTTGRGASMADTLGVAFGLDGEGSAAAPASVRAAYGTLKAWGL